jgi:hypothetical protein
MKINFTYLAVFAVGLFLLCAISASAQDDLPITNYQDPNLQELNLNEDKTLIYEPSEGKSLRTIQSMGRDTIKSAPAVKGKANDLKKPGTKTEDALSFNFLYYIIQKFKISDIVDQ